MRKIINKKFIKILNDLKRRPIDAAKDLGISLKEIYKIINDKNYLSHTIIVKACKVWPVNPSDFFGIKDDTKNDYKILRKKNSDKTLRIMNRGGKPYYKYQDTVMSKISGFRPELIEQLVEVKDDNPNNKIVKYNNGHFLNQFTYFVGPVNFYYINKKGNKHLAKMSTGDSMYISPYVPHSFTKRNKDKAYIIALTYSDKINNEVMNELETVGSNLTKKNLIKFSNDKLSTKGILENILKIRSINKKYFEKKTKSSFNEIIENIINLNKSKIKKVCDLLNVNLRDIINISKDEDVIIKKYKKCNFWNYPNDKNKIYHFRELANSRNLPYSSAFEFKSFSKKSSRNAILCVPSHQYLFCLEGEKVSLKINKHAISVKPGDSIYLKPNTKHKFIGNSKFLILRIGGNLTGDVNLQLSYLGQKKFERLKTDIMPWFNK